MDELSKADWQKILTRANQLLKDNLLNAAVQKGTADLAREMITSFDDDVCEHKFRTNKYGTRCIKCNVSEEEVKG